MSYYYSRITGKSLKENMNSYGQEAFDKLMDLEAAPELEPGE
jgi:hypothetical protein